MPSIVKRLYNDFQRDNVSDWAAALTYYGVLAIFPALLALVSILGLIGSSATQPLLDNIDKVAPGPAKDIISGAIHNLQKGRGTAGAVFLASLAAALWSASGYVAAFMRASNAIYGIEEGRPIWKTAPLRLGVTIVLVLAVALSAIAVVLSGGLADEVGKLLGVGHTAVTVWDIVKWPVILLVVGLIFSFLYYASPNVKPGGFRWVSPGGLLAVLLWVAVSAAFAFYVGHFGSYNKTYGALGGVVVFLVWLWLSNIALLLGAELNAEVSRGPEPRDTRTWDRASDTPEPGKREAWQQQ